MKKITLFCVLMFACYAWQGNAQVLSESFDAAALPAGWTQEYVTSMEDWVTATSNGDGSISPRSGSHMAEFRTTNSGDATKLITPPMDLTTLTSPQLTFYYANVNWVGDIDELRVYYKSSAGGTWTQIGTDYTTEQTSWTKVELILPNPSSDYYIAFEATSNWARGLDLDDVTVGETPACIAPIASNPSSITGNSADLEWTENGTAIAWDVHVVPTGDPMPDGTTVPTDPGVTTQPYSKTGLMPQTAYDFYVRADCAASGTSTWDGPISFATTCAVQLSGTYTIGATGDYTSLNAAVTALNTCGVSGPVTFDVLTGSGPYNEQVVITEFMGSSATNTVTFNGNGETLTAATTSGSHSLFLLDGADYVTINDFNMVTIEDTNNFVIQLTNDADFNTISNNTIDMSSTITSTSTSNAGIVVSGSLTSATSTTGSSGTDNVIVGNTLTGGYYGINVNGQSATRSLNNIITNNTLEDFYGYGISLRYNNNSVVADNEISRPTRSSVTTFYGIYLASGGEGNTVSGNNLHTPFGGITTTSTSANYGIYHTGIDSPVGNESKVINNIVHLSGNNGLIYALYNSSSDGVHYYHNTVVLDDDTSTAGTTRGFYQTTSASNIEVKNNVISILRAGSGAKYCLYFNTSGSSIVSDNNVLFMGATDGTTGIGYSGSAQATLADWQTATSGDANSVEVDPLFVNRLGSDFTPTNSAVNNIGTPVGVATDFNGDSRSATTPDPGAYEFTPPACPPPSALDVTNILSTSADLGWNENGTAMTWDIEVVTAGTSPTETPTDAGVTTNPFNKTGLTALTDYEFYVRADCGGGDLSTWVGPYTFKTDCVGPLAGTYTVGATGDFTTLNDVAYALNTCGISATTTFNVLPGSGPYEEQIVLGEIIGASATSTIAINGNGETLTAATVSSSRSLILLDGTDYTTIVNFNLVTISDTNNFVIQLTNDADNNVITNNTIDMSSTLTSTSTSNAGIVVSGSLTSATSTTGSSGTDNVIAGNTIIGGHYGINVNGQSATRSLNNIITNNTLEDFYSYGISLRYNNNSVVADNEVSRPTRTPVSTFYGVYLASGGEGTTVSGNNLHTPFGGITTTSTSANYGIYHTAIDSPVGNESLVFNNILHLTGNNGLIYALYNSSSDGVHYYHNTVVLDDDTSTAGTTRGFYQTTSASNIEVKNNVISILRTGSGAKYCLYFNTAGSSIVSDNNVLFMGATDGTTGIGYSGSAQATLADWQTATSGDANSVDVDPLFVNRLGSDFTPTNSAVNNIGTPVGVATDFNGDSRSATTPDPGAYEFTPPACPPPSALDATNITSTAADIGWTENGTAMTWDIEVVTAGTAPTGTPTDAAVTTNPFNKTGLTAQTGYDFYVRADCGATDGTSTWTGPFSFTTACTSVMAPWSEDFSNAGNIPSCWEQGSANGKDWEFTDTGTGHIGNNGTISGNTDSDGYFAWLDDSSPHELGTTLLSPYIDVSGLTVPELSFYRLSDNEGDSNVDFSVDVWDGAAWNDDMYFSNTNSLNGAWEKVVVNLSTLTITGDIQIRFVVDENNGTAFDDDVAIDDVSVAEAPVCFQPLSLTATNITGVSADLSWTEGGTANTWDIEVVTAGTTPSGTATDAGVSTNPFNKTGLTAQTDYEFYVRADCGGGDLSAWSGPYAFTTPCAAQLSGTYTIGATGDYTSLNAAVTALNTCGVSGPVTFDVLTGSGPYNEQVVITEFMGSSATNTVTFNGNGETLTAATTTGSRSLFLLDGADYVTINDFNMVTIEDTNNFVIQLTNDAENNVISNNTIDMSSTLTSTSTSNAGIVVSGSLTSATSTTGSSGTDNVITGNTLTGGYYGINVNGQSATRSLNNIITNNTLEDFYGYGISLRYNNNSVVADNEISRPTRSSVTTFYGIYLASGGEGNTVSENYLHTPFGGLTGTSSSANYGIYHTANDAPVGNESKVINNVVHLSGNNGLIYALYNSGSDGVHYYHNTVVLDDGASTSGTTRGFYQTTSASNIEVKNNVISILRTGSGAKYCLYFNTAGSSIVSDHNVLFMGATDGTTGIGYSGGAQATLADWQTATSGDANSVDVDPLFVNPFGGNFSPANPAVNNIGTPVGVATDFNGDSRSATTPDPGAYEFTPPVCPPPSALDATNITATAADIGWTENGTATTWDIEVVTTGTAPTGTPTDAAVTTNPFNKTGLTAQTGYDFYVRADCGATDGTSTWTGPFSFTTACTSVMAPWSEDFSNAGNIPSCWEQGAVNGKDWEFANTPGSNHIGDNGTMAGNTDSDGYFAWVDDSQPGATGTTLLSPYIDVSGLFSPELSFYRISHNEGNSNVDFSVDVWDGAAWNDDMYFSNTNSLNGGWEKIIVDLSTLTITGDIRLRFVIDENNGTDFYDDMAIDDVSVHEKPCYAPSNIIIGSISTNTADVTWTENGGAVEWEIEYGPVGFTPGSGTIVTDNDGTLGETLTGLAGATAYDVYIRALCPSGSTSPWVGPIGFTTACIAVTNFPYEESFEDTSQFRVCWTMEYVSDDKDWVFAGSNQNGSITPRTGSMMAHFATTNPTGDVTKFVSPALDLSTVPNPQLEFYYANVSWMGDIDELRVYYKTSFTGAWTQIGVDYTAENTTWTHVVLDLPNKSSDYYIAFEGTSNYGRGIDVDDVWIGAGAITCANPTNLTAPNIASTSAELSWDPVGNAVDGYTWYVFMAGDDPATATPVATGSTPSGTTTATATGLTAETGYDFYVMADCGANDGTSDLAGPEFFETTLGISNQELQGFTYHPNPVSHQLSLEANSDIEQVVIYDLLGREVLNIKPNSPAPVVDFTGFQSGTYLMKVSIGNSTGVYRIIKD